MKSVFFGLCFVDKLIEITQPTQSDSQYVTEPGFESKSGDSKIGSLNIQYSTEVQRG